MFILVRHCFMMALRLEQVESCLEKIMDFLVPFLPVANAHASDFITADHWNLLCNEIKHDLLALNKDQLRTLPYHSVGLTEELDSEKADVLEMNYTQGYTKDFASRKVIKNCEGHNLNTTTSTSTEIAGLTSLSKLCSQASQATVDGYSLFMTTEDFLQVIDTTTDRQAIGAHMNPKKCHEVEIIAEICSSLAKYTGCQLVSDLPVYKCVCTLYIKKMFLLIIWVRISKFSLITLLVIRELQMAFLG